MQAETFDLGGSKGAAMYFARRAAIRMGADTGTLPRSAVRPDEHAHCTICGYPGLEFERWLVEATGDYPSRFGVCDECADSYRGLDWCTVTPLRA
jgi:hypothetical protein